MTSRFLLILICSGLGLFILGVPAQGLETTYWVWHRKSPLNAREGQALESQGVRAVYWHAGTLKSEGDGWRLDGEWGLPASRSVAPKIIPVLRLSVEGSVPLGEVAARSLGPVLLEAARRVQANEVQIDFDCPDRRLSEYAALLANCRARLAPVRLGATALAGWSRLPAFEKLQASVDLLMPMFYDLVPDTPARVLGGNVLPLVEAGPLAKQLESWRGCRVPWYAGVPNFARVTVFNRAGASRGHLRAWDWDAVCFNPALALKSRPAPGVTLLVAETDTVVADTPLSAGEAVACRGPDRGHLGQAIGLAEKAGATGVAIFRLPGEGSQGGWSLPQLGRLLRERNAGDPALKLRLTSQGMELVNLSDSDLPPRLDGPGGPRDRGWQLEIESSAGAAFREANAGEFAKVYGHIGPEAPEPTRVAIPLARRLTYWFADLRAGESRQSGLLQLGPGVGAGSLRWRIPGSLRNHQWQRIE